MFFWLYHIIEKDYHELDSTICECGPDVKVLESGDMLIVHQSLIEPGKQNSPKIIEEAIAIISGK